MTTFDDYFIGRYGELPEKIVQNAQKDYVIERIVQTTTLDKLARNNMIRAVREVDNAVLFLLPYAVNCTFEKVTKYFVNYDKPGDFSDMFFVYVQGDVENTTSWLRK